MRFPKVIFGVPSLLVVAFFFLPWISVSCGGEIVTQPSGFNLAMGDIPIDEAAVEEFGTDVEVVATEIGTGDYELFLVPGLAVFALMVVFISDKLLLKGLYTGSAAAALGVMALYYWRLQQDITEQGAQGYITYEIWWWATIGVLGLMILMGMIYRNKQLP